MSQSTPINPKKAWTITLAIALIILTIFGSFILSNVVTVILFAIPIAVFILGSRNKIANIVWITVGVGAVELLAIATGVLDPLNRRLSNLGGTVQCLSAVILIIWAVLANWKRIAAAIGIPEGTDKDIADAMKQGVDEFSAWLHK